MRDVAPEISCYSQGTSRSGVTTVSELLLLPRRRASGHAAPGAGCAGLGFAVPRYDRAYLAASCKASGPRRFATCFASNVLHRNYRVATRPRRQRVRGAAHSHNSTANIDQLQGESPASRDGHVTSSHLIFTRDESQEAPPDEYHVQAYAFDGAGRLVAASEADYNRAFRLVGATRLAAEPEGATCEKPSE